MEIVVRGKNFEVPAELRSVSEEKLQRVARFVHDATRVDVEFSEVRNPRQAEHSRCEVLVHVKGRLLKAHAAAADSQAALDIVVDKIEHQAARLKQRRVKRSRPRHNHRLPAEMPFVEDLVLDGEPEEDALIVKTKSFAIKPMVPEEAALQMDLLGHDFYFFRNAESGQAAVIYRRRDGHLGLIEAVG